MSETNLSNPRPCHNDLPQRVKGDHDKSLSIDYVVNGLWIFSSKTHFTTRAIKTIQNIIIQAPKAVPNVKEISTLKHVVQNDKYFNFQFVFDFIFLSLRWVFRGNQGEFWKALDVQILKLSNIIYFVQKIIEKTMNLHQDFCPSFIRADCITSRKSLLDEKWKISQ